MTNSRAGQTLRASFRSARPRSSFRPVLPSLPANQRVYELAVVQGVGGFVLLVATAEMVVLVGGVMLVVRVVVGI